MSQTTLALKTRVLKTVVLKTMGRTGLALLLSACSGAPAETVSPAGTAPAGTATPAATVVAAASVAPAKPGAAGTSAETVGPWKSAEFSRPFRIDMKEGSYPVWIDGGATHANMSGGWDGGSFARITPPTSEQTYGGIGAFKLPDGVKSLSLRWETRFGPTFASGGRNFDDNKHVIFHTQNGNRPMMNLQTTGRGCLQMAIAQGTVKQFDQSTKGGKRQGFFRGEGDEVFRWCDTASSKSDIPANEWVSIELHISCEKTLHPSGHIRAIVYRRTGPVADWWIPWNYDSPAECTEITDVAGIGGYYNGFANRADGTWFDISGVTFAINREPLGPRAGFLQ
jgi:hypothetical protein